MTNSDNLPCTVILCPSCLEWGESVDCINCEGGGTLCILNAEVEPTDVIVGFAQGGVAPGIAHSPSTVELKQ